MPEQLTHEITLQVFAFRQEIAITMALSIFDSDPVLARSYLETALEEAKAAQGLEEGSMDCHLTARGPVDSSAEPNGPPSRSASLFLVRNNPLT